MTAGFQKRLRGGVSALAMCIAVVIGPVVPTFAADAVPAWRPEAAEKLVKLPTPTLQKTLDYDFAQSPLGQAMGDLASQIGDKSQSLADLQDAMGRVDGETQIELRHQFLVAKSTYIGLISQRDALERKHLQTELATLEGVLGQLKQSNATLTPDRQSLIQKQLAARTRLDATAATVDLKVLSASMVPESRYSQEYAANFTAIQQLSEAIRSHPMSSGDTLPTNQRDALRQMVANTQEALALLDQEEQLVAYMAKLVSLDAAALSDELMGTALADAPAARSERARDGVGFFLTR